MNKNIRGVGLLCLFIPLLFLRIVRQRRFPGEISGHKIIPLLLILNVFSGFVSGLAANKYQYLLLPESGKLSRVPEINNTPSFSQNITATFTATSSGGDWSLPSTWAGGIVPPSDADIVIPDGSNVTISEPTTCNSIVVESGGTLNISGANTLEVTGNWTNDGTFTANNSTVTFSGTSNSLITKITGAASTAFYDLIISKTEGLADTIEVDTQETFSCTHNITFTSGLLKFISGTISLDLNSGPTIKGTSGIWVAGATLNTGSFSIKNEGLIQVTSGTANFGTSSGNSFHTQFDGAFIVSGGNVFIAGRLENSAGGTLTPGISSGISISGGITTLCTQGNGKSGTGSLDVSQNGAFNFTGGTIIFQNPASGNALDIALVDGSGNGAKTTTGGTFQIGNDNTSSNATFVVDSEISLYNLKINSTNSPSIRISGNDLTVSNQLTMEGGNIDALTNNKKVILSNPAIEAINVSSGYITGYFTRAIDDSGIAYLFPVGNATNGATPLELYLTGQNTTGSITVSSTAGHTGDWSSSLLNSSERVDNYWTIENDGVTFAQLGGKLTYPSSYTGTYKVGIISDSGWSYPDVSGSSGNSISFSGLTSLDGTNFFVLAECTPPSITLGTSPKVCIGSDSANLPFTPTPSTNEYSIDFADASFADVSWTALNDSPILIAIPPEATAGIYDATLSVRNAIDCESSGVEFTVTVTPIPRLIITDPDVVCLPETVDLTAASVTAGSILNGATLSYWTDANATSSLTNPSTISISGTYYIEATISDCSDIEPVVVTVNPPPLISDIYHN